MFFAFAQNYVNNFCFPRAYLCVDYLFEGLSHIFLLLKTRASILNIVSKQAKLRLLIIGAIEAAIVVFCLVVSILVIVTITDVNLPDHQQMNLDNNGPLIGWFQNHSTGFFLIIVLPLFVILAIDVIYLIVYATRRESSLSDAERKAIEAQAREEARAEVLREMQEESKKE